PFVAGIALTLVSMGQESEGDLDGAVAAARRALELSEASDSPWTRMLTLGRLAELAMNAGRGGEALAHLRAAAVVPDGMDAVADAFGIRLALALAHLQAGAPDEAEHYLKTAPTGWTDDESLGTNRAFDDAVRAELALARGEVETGLAAWRRAVDL